MEYVVKGYKPASVFRFFEEISAILAVPTMRAVLPIIWSDFRNRADSFAIATSTTTC